jgi:hypothetical protein
MYPQAKEILSQDKEGSLLTVYRSYRSILAQFIIFFAALTATYGIIKLTPAYIPYTRWIGIIPVLLLLNIFRTYYNEMIHFERNKITLYFGRLGFKYEVPALKYIDIRGVQVRQSIMGRILDYGDVELGTSGAADYEMTIQGVRNPTQMADLIYDLRLEAEKLAISTADKFGSSEKALTAQLLAGTNE